MSFEEHLNRERVKHHAEELNRQRRRESRSADTSIRIAAVCILLMLLLAMFAPFTAKSSSSTQTKQEAVQESPEIPERELRPATAYASLEAMEEDYENEKIEAALLEQAQVLEECTVTWYTSGTCGKQPGDPTYGITASGLSVVEHLTCATDPSVIPMYSDVFVQYADGTIEQLWATDTGVNGKHVDIYIDSYDEAIQNGRQTLKVWFVPPGGM